MTDKEIKSTKGFTVEDIKKIFNISDMLDMPSAIMKLLEGDMDTRNDVYMNMIEQHDFDMSYDWFAQIYENELAQRKQNKQDFTPNSISILCSRLTERKGNLYEPTAGNGSMIIADWAQRRNSKISPPEYMTACWELSERSIPLLLLNLSIRGIEGYVYHGDVLEKTVREKYVLRKAKNGFSDIIKDSTNDIEYLQFCSIVSNPPFSAEWNAADRFITDDRFRESGILAPKSKADYAFVLDMIHHLSNSGTMTSVLPHGVLFRSSAEGKIRQFLIEKKNCIDAVIGLPANLFFGTCIPTCILVFKKNRKEGDGILFIDASREYQKTKTKNILQAEHIDKITETYYSRSEIGKYSFCATLQEVSDNSFNLNISRYVDTFEEEGEIDIRAVMCEIENLEKRRAELDREIGVYLRELGIV